MADTEDTETLVGIMRQATIDDDRPLPLSYPSDFAMFARAILASSWLLARDERIRADEREKLAAEFAAIDAPLGTLWKSAVVERLAGELEAR